MQAVESHFGLQLEDFNKKSIYTSNDVMSLYDGYAKRYEKECGEDGQYNGPRLTVEYFHKHAQRFRLTNQSAILDIGAGTGYVGQLLTGQCGYSSVDAVDCSQAMLDIAKSKGAYRNLYKSYIGDGHTLPMERDTYDGVLLSGVVVPGHLKAEAFRDIIRVTKPGGIIVNCMREQYIFENADCDVRPAFRQWEIEGLWRLVEWAVPGHLKHYKEFDSVIQVYVVC